jgi:hypothetical protein
MHVISALFDANPSMTTHMNIELWKVTPPGALVPAAIVLSYPSFPDAVRPAVAALSHC